jgi:hypothetical protein
MCGRSYRSPEYRAWESIRQRCYNRSYHHYHDYGGRGIDVSPRWLGNFGFAHFLEDMGERPSKEHSIDRKDNSVGYYPNNCRWATNKEQQRNTRRNRMITYNGHTACMAEWAEITGLHENLIRMRIVRGWSIARALTKKVGK